MIFIVAVNHMFCLVTVLLSAISLERIDMAKWGLHIILELDGMIITNLSFAIGTHDKRAH